VLDDDGLLRSVVCDRETMPSTVRTPGASGKTHEDCRHVSGSFERFLIGRGERVVRVAPRQAWKAKAATTWFARSYDRLGVHLRAGERHAVDRSVDLRDRIFDIGSNAAVAGRALSLLRDG
jgi:hypothetical protein